MALVLLPPQTEPLIDENSFADLNWLIFFQQLADGDTGTVWTPTFTGLTEVGTATKTGIYYRLSKALVVYRIVITPGTNTSSVAGTTYCNNWPLGMTQNGFSVTTVTNTAGVSGSTASDKRIYTPTWTTVASAVTIIGLVEVQ